MDEREGKAHTRVQKDSQSNFFIGPLILSKHVGVAQPGWSA